MITLSNNTGKSFEDAIVITGAKNTVEGVEAEYEYLVEKFGIPKIDWSFIRQSLLPQKKINILTKSYLKINKGKRLKLISKSQIFLGNEEEEEGRDGWPKFFAELDII